MDDLNYELKIMGFQHLHATSLKAKQIAARLGRWYGEGLAAGTFKNRVTAPPNRSRAHRAA